MAQRTIRDDNKGLKVLVDRESQTALDIVFVHGLRGHRINTWSSNNTCWPKDLLPEDIKDARILTFGYDAQVAGFLSTTSQASIFAHAEKLLDNLKNARRGFETRPIIFIGHSLGGIIIKDALIRSFECKHSTQDVRLGAIFNATIGVIFMATPHRGSHTASLAQYAVTAAKIALQNPNRHIIDGLKVDSQILEKQRVSFGAIIGSSKLRCAYEELPTHTQLIVGAASAMIDGVISVAIEADHVAICKFGSREDTGYVTIRGWILDIRENDPAVARKFGISTIIRYDELVGFEDDIQRMIREKINHMDLKEHFKDRLRSQLPQRAGHTFLLASLILATISKQRSLRPSDLNRLVRSEKPTDLYENALRSHPAHVRDRAFRLLKIVLVATEALTPGQLDLAECVNAEDCSLETLDREGNPEDALRDVCGVLLCVLNGKVFIFHETVREYLFEQDDFNPTGRPADHLLPDAHQILANCCVWFLNLDTWNQVKFHKNIREAIVIARIWFGSRLDDEMSCTDDIMFFNESRQPNLNSLNFQGCSLLGVFVSDHEGILDDSNHILEVLRLGADPDFRTSSPRTKSKMIGHVGQEVLKHWRDEDSISLVAMIVAGFVYRKLENDDNVSHGFNPKNLPMCVCSADTSLAPNLIAYRLQYVRLAYLRMSVAKASFDPQTPLALACHKGKWAVAERLLKHNASPSLLWKWYGLTKLFYVDVEALRTKGVCKVDFGDTLLRFLHLLQSFGLLAESINRCEELSGRTLVHFIMLADVRECDEFLNVDGIDLNVRNTDKETPLHWYMYAKGPTIDLTHNPRIRLFTRFDLTIKSPTGSSFLDAIFEGGRNQGSETCFASVKSSDLCTRGSFFLHKAIRTGARDWIDFFACIGDFDLNAQDDEGATALHLAVVLDDVATTLMLLSKGVRTDILDHQGKAAMHYAILRSRGIVKALIDSERVDLEILSRSRMTPLLEAFAHGAATDIMVTNVRLLVEALIERADSDDWIKPLDFVTNSIPYFERTGEELPELLKHMQSVWPPVQQDPMYLWSGSDSEDSDGMSSDEEWAEE
ncbi:hypothetical protein KCU98_g9245, partial [Aureobasidium melanogenum]